MSVKIGFYLHSQPNADGTRLVCFRYSHASYVDAKPWRGVLKNGVISYNIKPDDWIKNEKALQSGIKKRIYSKQDRAQRAKRASLYSSMINRAIDDFEKRVISAALELAEKNISPVPELVKKAVIDPVVKKKFWDAFNEFYEAKGKQVKPITMRGYDIFKGHLKAFERAHKRIAFHQLDKAFGGKLIQHFSEHLSNLTIKNVILVKFKTFLDFCFEQEYISNRDYKKWNIKVGEAQHIALSIEDINELYKLNQNIYIDRLLFHIWTGLRADEYKSVISCNGDILFFQQGKRKRDMDTVYRVKLLPPALKIWDRYSGDLPADQVGNFNKHIKLVLQKHDYFHREVIVNGEIRPLYKAISSHTGRRTLVTLMRGAGIDYIDVSKTVGHSTKGHITAHYDKSGMEAAFRAMDAFWERIGDRVKYP